jgi:type IV pilus biogenesis protein CpaD/CtpE
MASVRARLGVGGACAEQLQRREHPMPTRALVIAALLVSIAACTSRPINNVSADVVLSTPGKTAKSDDVRDAIVRAGTGLGWKMNAAAPGVVAGGLGVANKHWVNVDVQYTATGYSIVYRSSTNMKEKNGEINRNYNAWVENLNNAIRRELLRV